MSLLLISSLSACSSHKNSDLSTIANKSSSNTQTNKPQTPVKPSIDPMQQVTDLLLQAEQPNQLPIVLNDLQQLEFQAASPVKEEAAFRRLQLLLQHQYAQADVEAQYVLQTYPNHPLVAYTHFWLAQWWQAQEPIHATDIEIAPIFILPDHTYANHVLNELTAALRQANIEEELIERCVALSQKVMIRSDIEHKRAWYFAAAHADIAHRDYWVQLASKDLTPSDLQNLQAQHVISPDQDSEIYLHVARQSMMAGDMNSLQQLLAMLQMESPDSPLTQKISSWLYGTVHPLHLGVLLPLTGRYAHFGQQALHGIRLAAETQGNPISLSIQDTATSNIEDAYQALQNEGVDCIIGPLLSKNTETLATLLNPHIPVIALSMNQGVAKRSPALFVHNLSPETQGKFMASYAFTQGLRRIAIIRTASHRSERESMSFTQTFTSLGGDIAGEINLGDNSEIDHRPMLQQLRESSDDQELLQQLIEKRALFIPETKLDIHLPANMDGIYLAINGKQVSELAGQLAYVDIRNIPLLGSSLWMDGHILDDRGRNLSTARFIQDTPNPHNSELRTRFHDVWGEGSPSKLLSIAYDSTQIVMLLVSHLGITGDDMIQALHTEEGFPSETGHVRFNTDGMGEKTFSLYRIQQRAIVPAQ